MTSPVAPTSPPAVPEFPQMGDPAFNTKAFTFGTAMPALVAWIAAAIANAWNNATAAFEAAGAAAGAAASAADVQAVVLGAANFKGLWSGLTGALSKPATVKDGGRFWLLLDDLADVTAAVPGVSASWTTLDTGVSPTQLVTSSLTMVPGVRYLVTAPGITLTVPTGLIKSDYIGWRECIAVDGTYTVDFGSTKLRGVAQGSVLIEAKNGGTDMNYEDATRGLV